MRTEIIGNNGCVFYVDGYANEYDAYGEALDAITDECIKALDALIENYPKILEISMIDGKTLFHFAAEKSVKSFCLLIEKMPQGLLTKDARGALPAHYAPIGATLCKSLEGLELIEKYAPETMTATDIYNETPTFVAAHWANKNRCEVFNYFAQKYPKTLHIKPKFGMETPLEAAKRKYMDIPKQTQGEREL